MSTITQASVFVVSGGAKGITARCVEQIAAVYKCKFILLGRSQLAQDPAWTQGAADEPALKKAAMAHLKDQGEKPTPLRPQPLFMGLLAAAILRRDPRADVGRWRRPVENPQPA